MSQGSTLEKEQNKISIIVLPDKSTYLARWDSTATLSFLSARVPPLTLTGTPPKTGSIWSEGMKGSLMSLTVQPLVTTSGFPISSLGGDSRKRDKGPKCPTTVRDGISIPFPKPFSLFQPPAQPPLFLPPPVQSKEQRAERSNVQILKQFLCKASSGFNSIFFYFGAMKHCIVKPDTKVTSGFCQTPTWLGDT